MPSLVDRGGKPVWSAEEKAFLFLAHFNAKHCRDSFQQPQACDLSPILCSVAFWSSLICNLLLDLDSNGGTIPMVCFHFFYKQVAWELTPKLAVIIKHLVRGSSFPTCWRLTNVVSVPRESASSDVGDYRLISIALVLSKVFEKIMAGKFSNFLESNSMLPPFQISYRIVGA